MLKQDYEIEQQEDEDLRCPVCEYYFSNVTKPYLLPCNHNLCLKCIDSIIDKNMFYCPICRFQFEKDARDKFQVNHSFLSLVVKILKTKVIFCVKCSKVFNWTEHQAECDQRQFKETNELVCEVKTLGEDCIQILQTIDSYKNILIDGKQGIYSQLNDISKEINDSFVQKCQEIIETFYKNIPQLNIDIYYKNIVDYLILCEPLYGHMNVNKKELNNLIGTKNNNILNKSTTASYSLNKHNSDNKLHYSKKPNVTINTTSRHPINMLKHNNIKSCHNNVLIRSCNNSSLQKEKESMYIDKSNTRFDIEELLKDDDDDDNDANPHIQNAPILKNHNILIQQSVNFNTINNFHNNLMDSNKEEEITLGQDNNQEASTAYFNRINKIIPLYNTIKDLIHKIQSYSRQIEFTSQTIKEQISSNVSLQNNKITSNFSSIIDNIRLNDPNPSKRFLINYVDNSKKIWIYDVVNNHCETREFPFLKFRFNQSISIEFDQIDTIYITGGKFNYSIFSDEFSYEDKFYTIKWGFNDKIVSNEDICIGNPPEGCDFIGIMPRKRAMHSSFFFNCKLYIIGGESEKKNGLKECECYNSIDKRWELMPLLNYARIKPSLCIYNNTYLYVFKGDTENISYIEFINLEYFNQGWSLVIPDDPGSVWIPCSLSSCTVISDNQILICGGLTQSNIMIVLCYIYDPIRKTIYRSKDLLHSAQFSSCGVIYSDKLINIDIRNDTGKSFGVHIYDIGTNTWSFN